MTDEERRKQVIEILKSEVREMEGYSYLGSNPRIPEDEIEGIADRIIEGIADLIIDLFRNPPQAAPEDVEFVKDMRDELEFHKRDSLRTQDLANAERLLAIAERALGIKT